MELNILYAANHRYINIMATSMLSLIMNNKKSNIHFHIMTSNFTETDYILINNIINGAKNTRVSYYDVDTYSIEKFNIPNWRGTQIANARLFFADIVDVDNIDKILYLDSDTVVVGDLTDINNFKGNICAVPETILKYRLNELGIDRYFNSGVILFDVKEWLDLDYQKRIIDFRRANSNITLKYPDQDLLNASIGKYITELPNIYNLLPYALADFFRFNEAFYKDKRKYNPIEDIKSVSKDAKIYHSAGFFDIKPWMENKVNPMNEEFEKYAEMVNPDLNKEKLSGIRNILANNKLLFFYVMYLKSCVLPERVIESLENVSLKRKQK